MTELKTHHKNLSFNTQKNFIIVKKKKKKKNKEGETNRKKGQTSPFPINP